MTYQKLRQICNSNYQTPSWPINATTDQCDDPLSTCCCNSIAFSVRMLCINCQWDESGTSDPGHSANPYAYYHYRWSSGVANEGNYCGAGWNQSLPDSLQLSVCQKGIRLEDFLYSIFWPDGSWNFVEYEQRAQQILASRPQSLYCQNTTQNATSTASVAHTTSSGNSSVPPAVGPTNLMAAVGGLGGALGLVVIGVIIAIIFYRRRLRRRAALAVGDSPGLSHNQHESIPSSVVTPVFGQSKTVSQVQLEHTHNRTPPHREETSGSRRAPLTSRYVEEIYGSPVSVSMAPSTYGMSDSELPARECDTSRAPISHPQTDLPPDHRTVYSISS
ncbi:hypothetical protein C8Q72DRAFT_331056 [Fomitopsis betulina]|nr:hypothetical protein C8Q72DRAFT_331056 [Fomitopsis betulina]